MAPSTADFKLNDLVLAKVGDYPPWPAKVVDPAVFKREEVPGKVFVLFFFPLQVRHCAPEDLLPFSGQHRAAAAARALTEGCTPEFKKAVDLCEQEFARTAATAAAPSAPATATLSSPIVHGVTPTKKRKSGGTDDSESEVETSASEESKEPRRSPRISRARKQPENKKPAAVDKETRVDDEAVAVEGIGREGTTELQKHNADRGDKTPEKGSNVPSAAHIESNKDVHGGDSRSAKWHRHAEERKSSQDPPTGSAPHNAKVAVRKSRHANAAAEDTKQAAQGSSEESSSNEGSSSESESEGDADEEFSVGRKRRTTKNTKDDSGKHVSPRRGHQQDPSQHTKGGRQSKAAGGTKKPAISTEEPDKPATPEREGEEQGKGPLPDVIEKLKAGSKQQIVALARELADAWESDSSQALAQMLFLVLQLCGAPVVVTLEELASSDVDVDSVVQRQVVSASNSELLDFFTKGKPAKKFRANLEVLLNELVVQSQESLVFFADGHRIERILDLSTALSCSSPRIFRVAATAVALLLVSCFMAIALSLIEQREVTERQYNAEQRKVDSRAGKGKKGKGPPSAVLQDLSRQLQETHERIALLDGFMRKGFTGVLMHRYRDVDSSIRENCLEALGSWIAGYPSLFLQDTYTKYLGWMLNDEVASVRLAVVEALTMLYTEDNIPALSLFSDRFVSRLLQMTEDMDDNVCVATLQFLKVLLRHGLVRVDKVLQLSELTVVESPSIRAAAVDLLFDAHSAAESTGATSLPAGSKSKSGTDANQKQQKLQKRESEKMQELVCAARLMLPYSDEPRLCGYIVDALSERVRALQEWNLFCQMLDANISTEPSTEQQSRAVALLLGCSVNKAVGKQPDFVPADHYEAHKKDRVSKKEQERMDAARKELTEALIPHLPSLLQRFAGDEEITTLLLGVAVQLDLSVFSLKQDEQAFIAVLTLAKGAFLCRVKQETVAAAAKVLWSFLSGAPSGQQTQAKLIVGEAISEVVQSLKDAAADSLNGAADPSMSTCDPVAIGLVLQRLRCLLVVADWDDFAKTNESLRLQASPCENGTEDVLLDALLRLHNGAVRLLLLKTGAAAVECLQLLLLWSVIPRPPEEERGMLEETAANLSAIERRNAVRDCLEGLLPKLLTINLGEAADETDIQNEADRHAVIVKVLQMMSDFYSLLSPRRVDSSSLGRLRAPMGEETLRTFWEASELVLASSPDGLVGDDEVVAAQHARKACVLRIASRLVAMGAAPQDWLAPRILSYYLIDDDGRTGTSVKRVAQALLHHLRKDGMPSPRGRGATKDPPPPADKESCGLAIGNILVKAIIELYLRKRRGLEGDSTSDDPDRAIDEKMIAPCHNLAKCFLTHFVGLSKAALRPAVRGIVSAGVDFAFANGSSNMLFLTAGVLPFVPRLIPDDAHELLQLLESKKASVELDDDDQLAPCDALIDLIRERYPKSEPASGRTPTSQPSPARHAARESRERSVSGPTKPSQDGVGLGLKRRRLSFPSPVDGSREQSEGGTAASPEAGAGAGPPGLEAIDERGGSGESPGGNGSELLAGWGAAGRKSGVEHEASVKQPVFKSVERKSYSRRSKKIMESSSDAPTSEGLSHPQQGAGHGRSYLNRETQGSEDFVAGGPACTGVNSSDRQSEPSDASTGESSESAEGVPSAALKNASTEDSDDEGWNEQDVEESATSGDNGVDNDFEFTQQRQPGRNGGSDEPQVPVVGSFAASEEQLPQK